METQDQTQAASSQEQNHQPEQNEHAASDIENSTAEPQQPPNAACESPSESEAPQNANLEAAKSRSQSLAESVVLLDQIRKTEKEIAALCLEESELAEARKKIKKSIKLATEKLSLLIEKRDNPQQPEKIRETKSQTSHHTGEPVGGVVGDAGEKATSVVAWGDEPIAALLNHGLTESKVNAIVAASERGIFKPATIRGFRDWINSSEFWHRDIKGLGPKKIDSVIDALASYCKSNPEPVASEATNELTPDEERLAKSAAKYLGYFTESEPKPRDTLKPITRDEIRERESFDSDDEFKAYLDGREAGTHSLPVTGNPHRQGTALWCAWDGGHQETFAPPPFDDEMKPAATDTTQPTPNLDDVEI